MVPSTVTITPDLPSGLNLNIANGVISGTVFSTYKFGDDVYILVSGVGATPSAAYAATSIPVNVSATLTPLVYKNIRPLSIRY